MDRVIEGYNRAAAGAAAAAAAVTATAAGGGGSGDTEELPEDDERLEETARLSVLALAHASTSSTTTGSNLRAVFRSLGALRHDKLEVLRKADLQAALERLWRADDNTNSNTVSAVSDAAARLAARIVGSRDGVDYRRFEDWVMPPRDFEALRGVLIELVEEGSALGLTATELFLQFDGGARGDGIGSRELKKALASLSVCLTETEVEMVMEGAGCTGSIEQVLVAQDGAGQLLTLEKFSAIIQNPLDQRQRVPPITACTSAHALDTRESPRGVDFGSSHAIRHRDTSSAAVADRDGGVTPDSLAPRMSLSELLVDVREDGGGSCARGPASSSSTAAHVEAFGRVAADVQAVLATAVSSSGTRQGGAVSGGQRACSSGVSTSSTKSSRMPAPNALASSVTGVACATASQGRVGEKDRTPGEEKGEKEEAEAEGGKFGEEQETTATAQAPTNSKASAAASRSGPVPRTGAITPPLGLARSPSEPLHPTRESRERLEAALEGLDLKERLRPTTNVGVNHDDEDNDGRNPTSPPGARKRIVNRSAGARISVNESSGGEARVYQRVASSLGHHRRRPANSVPTAAGIVAGPAFSSRRLASHVGGDTSSSRRPGVTGTRIMAGVDRFSGRRNGGAGLEQSRRLGDVIDLAAAEVARTAAYDGGSEEAPEVIGCLRARVAELELSEQLLRCELEVARADIESAGHRAEEEARREAARLTERERMLQAKMGARLRAAKAEAAATAKSLAEFKRTAAAEAAARERSSADYLRRRLKEAEAAFEAKTARRIALSKQQQRVYSASRRRQGGRRESCGGESGTDSDGDDGGSGGDGGRGGSGRGIGSRRWAQQRARRGVGELAEVGGDGAGGDQGADKGASVMARLREELVSCRKKLAVVTAEVSRLRKEVTTSGKNVGSRRGNYVDRMEEEAENAKEGQGTRKGSRSRKTCRFCGEHRQSSRARQKQRERWLEARMAESEDARIEVEAEAGRLQAFVDELRGLGPPFAQPWRDGGEGAAE